MAGQSGVMDQSGAFSRSGIPEDDEDNPFFTGDPEVMPELGSITHGDASTFANENPAGRSGVREFDFKDDGESLELGELGELGDLDLANSTPPSSRAVARPNFDSPEFAGLDLPDATESIGDSFVGDEIGLAAPGGVGSDDLDLPAPAGAASDDFLDLPSHATPSRATPSAMGMASDDLLDLPTPSSVAPNLDLPVAAGMSPDLDLPAANSSRDLDLPIAAGMSPDLDLPGATGMSPDLDLPTPISDMSLDDGLSLDDLPMPSDDLPMPVDNLPGAMDDFPDGAIDDFPAPDLDLDELPAAADLLPTPAQNLPQAADILPTPAQNLPQAADILPTPVDELGLDLDASPGEFPSGEDFEPGPTPTGKVTGKAARMPPGKAPKRNSSRYIVYGLLGLVAVGVIGGALALQMGLFDPDLALPPTQSGDEGEKQPTPPPGEPAERSGGVLAKFDQDTPASYDQAHALSDSDPVGRAEASLLIHHRYGPDPERLAEASGLLAPYLDRQEPFIRRVVGLALLVGDKPDEALAKLEGDDPRTSLYRAWAQLEKGEVDSARASAEAAGAARPNDQAAQLAVLEARFVINPIDGIAAMRQANETSPNHLALQEALMHAALDSGRLDEAAKVGRDIQPSVSSDAHKAELLRQRAGIAMSQGRSGEAMRLLDQALTNQESSLAARIDRIDLWLTNKDFASVRTELDLLLRDHPQEPQILKMAARVDLEAGDDDDARARLTALGEAGANDPEVQDLLGQSEALLKKVDEARAAFAAARELDPLYTPATAHEVELLVVDERLDEAMTLLDGQLSAMAEAGAKDSPRGRRALATVARIRAEILRAKGELELALTAVEDASASDPADNDALLLRAELLDQLGLREAHEEALIDLHERTGGYPGLTAPLGKVLLRKGKLDELDALIGDSLGAAEASREVVLTGAALRLAQDKADEAQALAQKILERDPTDARAHLLLGRALLARGEHARALDEIESAQTREGDTEVELWLGQALEYNSRADEARAHYQRAIDLDASNIEAAALLGRLYAYEGGAQKAIDLLETVVSQTDDYPYAYLALGLAHKDMGKRALAISDFQKAQKLDPTLFEAFYQEGRIRNDENKHAATVKALQAGIDNAKDNATERALIDTYRRLGESYKQLGRRADAKAALQEYLKLAPQDAAGRREVERLLRDL